MTLDDLAGRGTITVPEAGQVLGIGRDAAYAAAKRGELPTLRLGRSLRVPVPKLLAMISPDDRPVKVAEPMTRAQRIKNMQAAGIDTNLTAIESLLRFREEYRDRLAKIDLAIEEAHNPASAAARLKFGFRGNDPGT